MIGLLHRPSHHIASCAILGAILLYAFTGSPTPNQPGFSEIFIATILLLTSTGGFLNLHYVKTFNPTGLLFIAYGLSIPLLIAIISGNHAHLILRDIIPFLFLCLPLFFAPFLKHAEFLKYLTFGLLSLGLLFSARSLIDMMGLHFWLGNNTDELFYFANSPAVLFSALHLTAMGGVWLSRGKIVTGTGSIIASALPLFVMAASMQRASLALYALSIIILLGGYFIKSPKRAAPLLILTIMAGIAVWPLLNEIALMLGQKTELVGMNKRLAEIAVIWNEITIDPLHALFGLGWGGTFISPATDGDRVNFAHGLLSGMLLKTGLIGLSVTIAYLWTFLQKGWKIRNDQHILFFALGCPIAIDVLFYGAYKSLDFGLMLVLLSATQVKYCQDIEENLRS